MLQTLPRVRERGPGSSRWGALPWVGGAAALAVVLRLPSVGGQAFPDEGGALLVARHWRSGGPGLYGPYFFDRPPLLVLLWQVADRLGGVQPARWLATVGVVVLVLLAGWAGRELGGRRGAHWSAFAAAALASTPLLGTQEVDGELLAAPLVMLSCDLTLAAVRHPKARRVQLLRAFGAGVAGAMALLVKQNLADGLVFAVALVIAAAATRAWPRATVRRVLVPGALGTLLPVSAVVLWAATQGPGVAVLWHSLYGFRADAAGVIATHSMSAPDTRLAALALVSVVSGLVAVVGAYLWVARSALRTREPIHVAVVTMLASEVVGIALGGSYWPHYLIALVPAVALAAGLLPRLLGPRDVWPRRSVPLVVGSAVVAALVAATPALASTRAGESALVSWLSGAHRPGDSAIVTYGHPDLVEASGLRPARYPYLWSLPLRTEDPRLARLRATLSGSSAPTWLVEWLPFDTWGIDPAGRLAAAVARHYRPVGVVCGVPVFLRDGVHRRLPAHPASC
jgi:hypothetical protein